MATAPHTRGVTHTRMQSGAPAAAAAGHKRAPKRAAVSSATAPTDTAASRPSRQAAFLQLTATIEQEVAEQQQRLDRIFADITGRCEQQIGADAARRSEPTGAVAASASACTDGESKEQPNSAAARFPCTAFHVPAQLFRFTTAEAVSAVHSALSSSVAALNSAVEHGSLKSHERPPPPTFQLRLGVPTIHAAAGTAAPSIAPSAAPPPPPPPFVRAQLTRTVDEVTPAPSPQPPTAHPLPSVPPSAHRPATPLRLAVERGAASASAVQFGAASGQVDEPVPAVPALPLSHEQKDNHAAATPRSASTAVLASFPALQRAADVRAAAMQPPIAAALDPFPSLSRALQLRQERLRMQANSQQPSASMYSAPAAASASSSASTRPLFSDAIHPAPIAAVSVSAAAPSSQQLPATVSPAEADRLSVALLLKQQSLSLLCTQFQARVGRLTRHRFLITWRWRLRLLRMTRAIERIQCRSTLRVWHLRSREWIQWRHEAATKIQSVVRRRLAQREFAPLQLSVHHRRRTLLARLFSLWLSRYARVRRWRYRWTSKLSVWGSALRLHGAWGSAAPFPARQWRSTEGTMRMAQEWAAWRQTRKVWGAWIQFMGRKRTEDRNDAKGAAKLVRIQRH